MENSLYSGPNPALRVLLAGDPRSSSIPFMGWLWDQGGCVIAGPAVTLAGMRVLAGEFRPDVIILDFHRLAEPLGEVLALFKALVPVPKVFVLTHELNHAWRRRCAAMGADAVFHKTEEFDELAAALVALRLRHDPRPSTLCTSAPPWPWSLLPGRSPAPRS